MKEKEKILLEGIEFLRKSDEEINRLIISRVDDFISRLVLFLNEIELFNPAYGLVGTNDTQELIVKHILDSIAPLGILSRLLKNHAFRSQRPDDRAYPVPENMIADAGSGAGLPGIPLAAAMPDARFTLIERMGRRAGFLLNTKAVLSLSNITVEENELEKTEGCFDLVTFRAFKPLEPKLLKTLYKICKPSGIIAAYKGKREKIESEMTLLAMNNEQGTEEKKQLAANNTRFQNCGNQGIENKTLRWEAIPYTVPFLDEERHLLVIKI